MQAELWTISGLAVELERDRRTLARSLEGLEPDQSETDGAGRVTRRYRMARVVAHLFTGDAALDGNAERARKDKESADKLALENALTRSEVGLISEMEAWFGSHVERAQARLIQIPDALGQFCDTRSATIVVGEARRLIHEALEELAADGAARGSDGAEEMAPTAEPDGVRVVGSAPKAVKRKQRGAGAVAN